MSTFERILVPVDGSVPSEQAIALAVRLAADLGAALTFCNVLDREAIVAPYIAMPYGDAGPSLEHAHNEGERLLRAACAKAGAAGIAAQSRLVEGLAVDEIVRLSEAEHSELIVMGSHGRRGVARMFMGSVAEGVLRSATVPVLVVRSDEPDASHASGQPDSGKTA
ncbi:MAG: universal stress protein [Vulcanimicrobiaceae bacterium]